MRFRAIRPLAAVFLACFAFAVFTQAHPANANLETTNTWPANQSVSGQIASVGDAVFVVSTKQKENEARQTVEFLVDDKTKVEGKLAVGAQVLVEYRSDSGKNIAVHVVVTPAGGLNLF